MSKKIDRLEIKEEICKAAELYREKLVGKSFLYVFEGRYIEVIYKAANFKHLTPLNNSVSGIEKGDFYCYEIKSCAEDLHSGHGWNFFGDFNYFVMPKELYAEEKGFLDSLFGIGILVPEGGKLVSIKSARRTDRKYPASYMLLMMMRPAARDRKRQFPGIDSTS